MKPIFFLLLILITFQFAYAQKTKNKNIGTLTVIITGLENNTGVVRLGLYNSKDNYEGKGKAYRGEKDSIENKQATFIFYALPYGKYAIKVYHDENSNGMIDRDSFGIPTEAYGFSNNASGAFGPADYNDAKFLFNKNKTAIKITVH